jgi:hypothetical protein
MLYRNTPLTGKLPSFEEDATGTRTDVDYAEDAAYKEQVWFLWYSFARFH